MNCTICGLPTGNIVGSVMPQCKCGWQAPRPPQTQRTWVGLTDEDMLEAIKPLYANPFLAHNALEVSRDEYQAIEAKLKEKNT